MSHIANFNIPERVTSINHPLVSEAYLKKGFSANHESEDILVIETTIHEDEEHDAYDNYLTSFMGDLHDLQLQAEQQIGHFDRIDIRTH